jgi:ribosomal protein S12 methylthiotransferase accessory factor
LTPELALERAVLEAAQARLTLISGARDDILFEEGSPPAAGTRLAFPLPAGLAALSWEEATARSEAAPEAHPGDLAALLAEAGYPDTAAVDLSRPGAGVHVAKVFCPGLGAFARARRPVE